MANEERRLKAGLHGQRDPIQKALREQSTHYEAGTRITVYERLGLNKPGFWADHQQRKLEQEETDADYEAPTPQWTPETLDYKSQNVKYKTPKTKGITIHPLNMPSEAQPGPQAGTGRTRRAVNKGMLQVTANVFKSIQAAHPMLSTSSSDLIAGEKYGAAYNLSQQYGALLQTDPMASMAKFATQYYFAKAKSVAESRANIPFGEGLPTNFDKMQDALYKPKKEVKGNTRGEGVQETQQKEAKQRQSKTTLKGPGKAQLNVHKNSYASNYMTPNIFS